MRAVPSSEGDQNDDTDGYVVSERDHAIVTQVDRYLRTSQAPGLHFKLPFYESTHHFDRRILLNDSTPAEYLTLDKKRVVIDHVIRWRIEDPHQFFITVREPIMETVARRASDKSKGVDIEVVDVRIKRADLPEEVQASVFGRMVAERDRIASRYRSEGEEEAAKVRAEADKERTILHARAYEVSQVARGEGDAEAARIYADAYSQSAEFYAFVRSLEAYEKSLKDGGTLILSADSDLFWYLTGPTP